MTAMLAHPFMQNAFLAGTAVAAGGPRSTRSRTGSRPVSAGP